MLLTFTPSGHILLLGVAGYQYNQIISISGGIPPYNIILQGRLPGITMSIQNTEIILSGIPKIMGTFSFTLIITDSNNFTQNQTYKIKFSLEKFAKDLEQLRQNAISLKLNYSDKLFETLYYDFKTARINLLQIQDPSIYDIVKSVLNGLYDIIGSPYILLDDSLEIVITTLPSTIRFIQGLS